MVELILTMCISATTCDAYVLDKFDTLKECIEDRAAFIVDRKLPYEEAIMLSCEVKHHD